MDCKRKHGQKQIVQFLILLLVFSCSLYYFVNITCNKYYSDSNNRIENAKQSQQQDVSIRGSDMAPHIIDISRQISILPIFFSFSQFREDVILYHIFQGIQNGFYVDIGAHHPTLISDTKIFYEMGWSGINIEPLEDGCRELKKQRVRDINLCVTCGPACKVLAYELAVAGRRALDFGHLAKDYDVLYGNRSREHFFKD